MIKYFISCLLLPLSLFGTINIAVIGDSITMGVGATNAYGYLERLQDRYDLEGKDIKLLNRAYGGAKTDTLLAIGITTVTMEHPDYILLFLGINDAGFNVPQATLLANFSAMMQRCTGNCKKIVLGGVNSALINPVYNGILATVYSSLITTYNPYPVMLLGTDIHPYCPDLIHPNDTGHQMIADNLYNVFHLIGLY